MTWFEGLERLVPLTVVTAIVLFVIKEVIEVVRRQQSRARKTSAIRTLLIEEMELNNWTIKSLRSTLEAIDNQMESDPQTEFYLKKDASGAFHYRYRISTGGDGGASIPHVHRKHFDAFLPELAEVDKRLFEEARKGYERIGQLEHVRSRLIAHLAEDDPDEKMHLQGFPSYALQVIDDVESQMSAFYVFCSGRPFEKIRLR